MSVVFRAKLPDGSVKAIPRGTDEGRYLVAFRDAYAKDHDLEWLVVGYCSTPGIARAVGGRWIRTYRGEFRVIEAEVVRPDQVN
jgi:hypothetical protein